jgi:hypothetical protein
VTREADDLDQAAGLTQQLTDAYVSNARAASRPEQVQGADGTWPSTLCREPDCGVELPPARLAAGRAYCIDCQIDRERAKARR